ncbi:MAG: hypothetical protein Q8880_11055, partial [Bacteroidota bacterium]|nr:hypothetical protein [Bacteroidota bacterium]
MDFYLKKYLAKTYVAVKNSKTGKVTYKVRTKVVKEKDPITGKVISTTVPVTKVKKEEVDYSINLKYGVNTYELILPLSYNLGEFTLNFQFAYYINVRQPKDFAVENYPVYDVGITYEF